MIFNNYFQIGAAGEALIASWFRSKGYTVLPIYEKTIDTGKGPQLYLPQKELIAPDFFVFKKDSCYWIEAKHKTAFTWHRITGHWVTGIDIKHYEHYLEVNRSTPWPVWLLFLHEGGQSKDDPPNSPAGLFGNTLDYLSRHENHRHDNWGKYGMVYWRYEDLILCASLEEIYNIRN